MEITALRQAIVTLVIKYQLALMYYANGKYFSPIYISTYQHSVVGILCHLRKGGKNIYEKRIPKKILFDTYGN